MKHGYRKTREPIAPELDKRPFTTLPISLFAATFLVGFGLMYATCFISLHNLHATFSWSLTIYSALLCLVVFLLSGRLKIQMLYYLAAPLTLTGIALSLLGPSSSENALILTNLGCYTYFVFVMVLHCSISHKQNLNPLRATAFLVLLLFVGIYSGRYLFSMMNRFAGAFATDTVHAIISASLIMTLIICLTLANNAAQKEIISREVHQRLEHVSEYDTDEFAQRIMMTYKLTDRELDVLKLLLKGKTATEISAELVIANGTAKAHINRIYRKLNIHTKEELFEMIPASKLKA